MADETKGQGTGKGERARPAHRQGDVSIGAAPPAIATGGSPNVTINGRAAMREGDTYSDGSVLTEGSRSVTINGKPAGRLLDSREGGGVAFSGSPNVFIGDYEETDSDTPDDDVQEQSPCQTAQQKAQEETERIKNSYDHNVKNMGTGLFPVVSNILKWLRTI